MIDLIKELDHVAAVNLQEPSPGDLERVVNAYHRCREELHEANEALIEVKEHYDNLYDDHKRLLVQYDERGYAMKETGDMVRSLYTPKINRAQNMLNTLLQIDLVKTDKELIRDQIKEIKRVLK